MSSFSSNSSAQPPLTSCSSAIELRVSPLTTLYSPSPLFTFLPVGVVTVFFWAGRSAERDDFCSAERSAPVSCFGALCCEPPPWFWVEPPPVYAAPDRPLPHTGQAPLPWPARTFSAISLCCALAAWSARQPY